MNYSENIKWMKFTIPGKLTESVRYSIRTVVVGPYYSAEEHEKHISNTVGIGDPLLDIENEFRFSPKTGILESFRLIIPEKPILTENLFCHLSTCHSKAFLPIFIPFSDTSNKLDIEKLWIDNFGNRVVFFSGDEHSRIDDIYEIAKDLYFFIGPCIYGFLLYKPAFYLTKGWEMCSNIIVEPCFSLLLAKFVCLLNSDTINQLEDGDKNTQYHFRQLYQKLTTINSSPQVYALRSIMDDLFETFDF